MNEPGSHSASLLVGNATVERTYRRIKSEGGLDFFVHNDVDLDSSLGGSLKHNIETILLVSRWRSTKVKLRAQPPVEDIYALLRPCQTSVSGDALKVYKMPRPERQIGLR